MVESNYSMGDVIGGSGYPTVYSLDREINNNVYFDNQDVPFIVADSDIEASVLVSEDSIYSDLVLKIISSSSDRAVFIPVYAFDVATAVNEFFFGFFIIKAISGSSLKIGVASKSGDVFTKHLGINISPSNFSKQGVYSFLNTVYSLETTNLYIYFELPVASEFHIYVASLRVVLNEYVFEIEQQFLLEFEKVIKNKAIVGNGQINRNIQGWRPYIKLLYEYLSSEEEKFREFISEANVVAISPRSNSFISFVCQWQGDYRRDYLEGRHLGYKGDIPLESVFLLKEKPSSSDLLLAIPRIPIIQEASNILYISFSANCKASFGASGYYLDVSEDEDFSSFVVGYENLDIGNVIAYTVSGLSQLTPYYFRFRAYNSFGTSFSSKVKSLITLSIPVYEDWFLPSKDELHQMYLQLYLYNVGNFFGGYADNSYISSSEAAPLIVWAEAFLYNGSFSQSTALKSVTYRLRPCRSFTAAVGVYSLRQNGPLGGWVFWTDGAGNYLECSLTDLFSSWSNIINVAVGSTGTATGTGQANTTAIIGQVGHTTSAAKLCDDLVI